MNRRLGISLTAISIAVGFGLLTLSLASAQDGATGSGTTARARGAAAANFNALVDCGTMTPPVVGYEVSRAQDSNDAASLLNDLAASGFSVGTVNINTGPIPACVDVLVVLGLARNISLSSAYTAADGAALKTWTTGGHGLFLLSDWGFFKDATQALFQAYGYTLQGGSNGVVTDPTDFDPAGPANSWVIYQSDNFAPHTTLNGVASLELVRSSWFTPALNALVTTDADASPPTVPVLAAFRDGAGCVGLSADSNWITDFDGAYLKQNNALTARQMVSWLDGCGSLALTKAATPTSLLPGQLITYTLTATSYYTFTLTNVVITDTVPTGTTFVSASSPYTGPDANGVVRWSLGTLNPNASAGVTMVVRANSGLADGTLITNTARVSSNEGLTDTASAVVRISLSPVPTPTATPRIPVTGPQRLYLPLVENNACLWPGTYRNDFEGAIGAEWSHTSAETTPSGRRFLGQFGNQTVSLTLACLPAHTTVTLSFDLFIIRSWDGNITYNPTEGKVVGPDVWDLGVAGRPTLLHTSFANWTWPEYRQAYPGTYPGGDYAARTGATEGETLGYQWSGTPLDSVYHLTLTFGHASSSLELNFSAVGLQALSDESWGLDNVEMRVASTP